MKNFLLVVPRFARVGGFYNFPLGLAYISSSLKSKGFNVHCLNLCHTDEPLEIVLGKLIKDKNIDVLGTGGMSQNWDVISAVFKRGEKRKAGYCYGCRRGYYRFRPRACFKNHES